MLLQKKFTIQTQKTCRVIITCHLDLSLYLRYCLPEIIYKKMNNDRKNLDSLSLFVCIIRNEFEKIEKIKKLTFER